jgi:hypothetical protein
MLRPAVGMPCLALDWAVAGNRTRGLAPGSHFDSSVKIGQKTVQEPAEDSGQHKARQGRLRSKELVATEGRVSSVWL